MGISGYGLQSYGQMITCEPRMGAYARALEQSITPGCHVIDLGAGPGLFALLACRYGAGSVVAIEPDTSIEIARQAARANGFADRITFVEALSTAYVPDRKADVVVSDIRGVMPLFENHIPTIVDVRARLLAPGGTLIPGIDRIHAALVEAPAQYAKFAEPWASRPYGIDMSAALGFTLNGWTRVHLGPEALMSDPAPFATLDYRVIDKPDLRGKMEWRATRPGTVHGILMWFETELVPGVRYSNAPDQPELVYGQAFFPLERPVPVIAGAEARAEIAANLVHGQYIWSWSGSVTAANQTVQSFRQSSFRGEILTRAALAPRAATFCPPARRVQEVDMRCLALFDGKRSLAVIADSLVESFPDFFRDARAAFDHVAALSARYNRPFAD
jgi:type I protein arginine methyltransferase